MTGTTISKSSMIIDGIAASEAIDSSGEILVVGKKEGEGCDISDLVNGVGVLNYEHRGDDSQGASANDVIGKIIFAKKIFSKDDCGDKRQEAYWNHVKLPFIYIKARLYDGADHPGAKAAAAIIRDAVTHGEPILARFSIEGSTLKKEGQKLVRTIARKVALTLKPANKSAISGLVSDPNGPKPITEKQADKTLLTALFEDDTKKNQTPGRQTLGSHAMAYDGLEVEQDPSELMKMTAANLRALIKTMTGGSSDAAPSTLTGGAALAREEIMGYTDRERLKNNIRAAVRDYNPVDHGYGKSAMLKFFKWRLPEVNEKFLDHFTDLVDDVRTRQVGHWFDKTMGVWGAVQKAEKRGAEQAQAAPAPTEPPEPTDIKPVPSPATYVPTPQEADPRVVIPKTKAGVGMTAEGQLLTSKLRGAQEKLQLYDYSKDQNFLNIIHADDPVQSQLPEHTREHIQSYVHRPWLRAMQSWLAINNMAKEGVLPDSLIAHASIFSAMSPNTAVPMQELYYGHYMDFKTKYGDIFLRPTGISDEEAAEFHKWLNKATPPEWFKEFYQHKEATKSGVNVGGARKQTLNPSANLADRPQGLPLLNYHRFHPFLTAFHKEMKDDGRAFSDFVMQQKDENGAMSFFPGFGPKLTRYAGLMMGMGNVVVPDRHQLRALFNLPAEKKGYLSHIFNVLTPTRGEKLLRAIDNHFFEKSPAVQKVLGLWPDHFRGREQQAIGPAFWLQWLAYPHYETLLGRDIDNKNMGTAHDPFFKSVVDVLDSEAIPHSIPGPGEAWKMQKSTMEAFRKPMTSRVAAATKKIEDSFGEAAASFFFHAWGVPALLFNDRAKELNSRNLLKAQYLLLESRRLFKQAGFDVLNKAEEPAPQPEQAPAPTVSFQGRNVNPGLATVYGHPNGTQVPAGRKMAILGRTPEGWLMVPHERLGDYNGSHLEKWPYTHHVELHTEPTWADLKPGVVDSQIHMPSHYGMHSKSHELIHGLDMNEGNQLEPPKGTAGGGGKWRLNANGKRVYVKWAYGGYGIQSQAHGEALYHNLAHNFFGMGDFVPTTAVFNSPHAKPGAEPDWHSAIEGVTGASHFSTPEHAATMTKHLQNGDLHKIALMDALQQNTDRHNWNYLFDENNKLKLIDHGFAYNTAFHERPRDNSLLQTAYGVKLADGTRYSGFPNYREAGKYSVPESARKWFLALKPDEYEKQLREHQVPESAIHFYVGRLKMMQAYMQEEPEASFQEVANWPRAQDGKHEISQYANQQRAFRLKEQG